MMLARALWLGYRAFRRTYPCSLVTPERIAWALRHMPWEAAGWQSITETEVADFLYWGKSPDLELIPCGSTWLVVERALPCGFHVVAEWGKWRPYREEAG